MAKKQTRRTISVSKELYDRLIPYCETNNITVSSLVENQLRPLVKLPEYTRGRPRRSP